MEELERTFLAKSIPKKILKSKLLEIAAGIFAGKSYKDIEKTLKKYNYKKILV